MGPQTLIAGLTADALIAPWVIKDAMDRPAFAPCVSEVLVPEIEPGTVVILDDPATHRNAEATRALRDKGCWFLYLPPYSPDLNPVEQAFSKLKAHLRKIGAGTFTAVFDAIGAICDLYDPQECWNCFRAAGYVSGQCRNASGLMRRSCTRRRALSANRVGSGFGLVGQ